MMKELMKSAVLISALSLVIASTANADDIDDIVMKGRKYPVFIEKPFLSAINKTLSDSNSGFSSETISSIQKPDYRGLHLTDTYQTVLNFTKKENLECQYGKQNFYSVNEIMGAGQDSEGHTFEDEETRVGISQKVFFCHEKGSSNSLNARYPAEFGFTPLGRLYMMTVSIASEEDSQTAIKRFQEKYAGKSWETHCFDGHAAACRRGKVSSADENFSVSIDYNENHKTFENGAYSYVYRVNLSSKLLFDLDYLALRKTVVTETKPDPTKF